MPSNFRLYTRPTAHHNINRSAPVVLGCRDVEVLFLRGHPAAICDGVEVSFPDGTTPNQRGVVNKFHPDLPQTRVDPEDFRYLVVSGLMRSLRPLLRRNQDDGLPSSEVQRGSSSEGVL